MTGTVDDRPVQIQVERGAVTLSVVDLASAWALRKSAGAALLAAHHFRDSGRMVYYFQIGTWRPIRIGPKPNLFVRLTLKLASVA